MVKKNIEECVRKTSFSMKNLENKGDEYMLMLVFRFYTATVAATLLL